MENLPGITTETILKENIIAFYKSYYNSKIAAKVILAKKSLGYCYKDILLVKVPKNINLCHCVYEINESIEWDSMKNIVIKNFIGFEVTDKDCCYKMDVDIKRLYRILYSKKFTATEKKQAEKKNISLNGINGLIFSRPYRYQFHLLLKEKRTNKGMTPYGRELNESLKTIHKELQNI